MCQGGATTGDWLQAGLDFYRHANYRAAMTTFRWGQAVQLMRMGEKLLRHCAAQRVHLPPCSCERQGGFMCTRPAHTSDHFPFITRSSAPPSAQHDSARLCPRRCQPPAHHKWPPLWCRQVRENAWAAAAEGLACLQKRPPPPPLELVQVQSAWGSSHNRAAYMCCHWNPCPARGMCRLFRAHSMSGYMHSAWSLAAGPASCHIPAWSEMRACHHQRIAATLALTARHTCRLLAAWSWLSPTAMRPVSSHTVMTWSAGSGQRLRLWRLLGRQSWLTGKSCCTHLCPATTEVCSQLCNLSVYAGPLYECSQAAALPSQVRSQAAGIHGNDKICVRQKTNEGQQPLILLQSA